jgi:hypothetical protein
MLPESQILKNSYHNRRIVEMILEQPSLDNTDAPLPGNFKSLVDQAQIPGLSKSAPRWLPDELKSYLKKQGKKSPVGLAYYPSYAAYLADVIYKSKGITDNEQDAMLALMQIKSAKEFTDVQKELQKKTGGQGIGQFISGFFGTYTTDKTGKVTGWSGMDHWKTAKRLNSIITHLKKINANAKSIEILEKTLNTVREVAKQEKARYQSDEFAIERWSVEHKHEIALALSIAAMFVPIAGWGMALSSGIMLADAAMYYDEGRYFESGTMVIFALIPYIGGAISKSVAVQQLGAKGMAKLGQKLATSKSPILNRIEQAVIKDMNKYAPMIKQDMNEYFQARFKNELVDIIKKTQGPKARRLLYRLGNGTIKASAFGAKLGTSFIPYELSTAGWEKVYTKFDIQSREIAKREALEIQKILGKR